MKKISILLLALLIIVSCKEGEEESQKNTTIDKEEVEPNLTPIMNVYGEDSIDASGNIVYGEANDMKEVTDGIQESEEDLGYTLGTRPDQALVNQYGEDSIDANGNFVYPARDTIWDEE